MVCTRTHARSCLGTRRGPPLSHCNVDSACTPASGPLTSLAHPLRQSLPSTSPSRTSSKQALSASTRRAPSAPLGSFSTSSSAPMLLIHDVLLTSVRAQIHRLKPEHACTPCRVRQRVGAVLCAGRARYISSGLEIWTYGMKRRPGRIVEGPRATFDAAVQKCTSTG